MDIVLQVLKIIGSTLFMVIFFGLCIFVHELGHFLVARWCGLHVIAFSIGFKKVWAKKINGVEYRIGCIPMGGYVDLPQIDATGEPRDENDQPLPRVAPWKRMVTAFAGPFFNVLFALLLGCVIWVCGLPQSSPKMQELTVSTVQKGKPEYNAGLRPGDVIFLFNGHRFNRTWNEFSRDIMLNIGDVVLTVRRGSEEHVISYRPIVNTQVAASSKIPYPFFTVEIPVVLAPLDDSPAANAGLKTGDKILSVNGEKVGLDDFLTIVRFANGKPLVMEYERKEKDQTVRGTATVQPKPLNDSFCTGIVFSPNQPLKISAVAAGMPAANELKAGDVITAFNGTAIKTNADLVKAIQLQQAKPFTLTVKRGDKLIECHTAAVPANVIGVGFQYISYPTPMEQMWNVLDLTWRSLKSVGAGIGRKMGIKDAGYTTLGPQHFSGPAGIGQTLYLSVYKGSLIIGLNLVVMISLSLGLFNLLPIPVLDGGHILLSILEMLFRRPLSPKIIQPVTYFFVFVLIGFMVFVTFFDIKRLLPAEAEKRGEIVTENNMTPTQAAPETKEGSDHDKLPAAPAPQNPAN